MFLLPRKKCFFVDLFVRVSNKVAVNMYRKLGYEVYRTVLEYYSGDVDEDAYGKEIQSFCSCHCKKRVRVVFLW